MLRSGANDIPELLRRLGSRKPTCVDAARARLSIVGPRAVDPLIDALEGDNHRVRARVMPLLALIQDPRGRAALIAMLLDRDSRLRVIAAQCLGRFPAPETVAALNRVLERERSEKVKAAAVRSLVEQYAAGQDPAICRVLDLLSDGGASTGIRLAAVSLLPKLRPSTRRSMLNRLKQDADPEVQREALRFEERSLPDRESPAAIETAVNDLASKDYSVWNAAVGHLTAGGSPAVRALLREMQSRAHDPEYCTRAGMALKAMGRRRIRELAGALDEVEEPLPLQVLVEVIGALGEKSLIYRLKGLIDRLGQRPTHPVDVNGWDPLQRVRAAAHLELARIGSRVAIGDLDAALADSERRVEPEMLTALELIGKPEEIAILLRAYGREDPLMKQRIADVVRVIRTRERVRRNSRLFRTLSAEQLRALDEILPRKRRPRVGQASRNRS